MKIRLIFTTVLLTICNLSFSQIRVPEASSAATLKQTLGFAEVMIEYNRPQLKGRDIFKDLTNERDV